MEAPHIAVLGDLVLDIYTFGEVDRISPEAPVPVLQVRRREQRLGGAGNVLLNLNDLEVHCTAFGRIGAGLNGKVVQSELRERDINSDALVINPELPTITKHRMVAQNQQLLRIDDEIIHPLSQEEEDSVMAGLEAIIDDLQAVVLSDYGKGFLTRSLTSRILDLCRERGVPTVVDPKGDDFSRYRKATVITPNFKEAKGAATRCRTLQEIAQHLLEDAQLDFLLITRSQDGISHFHLEGDDLEEQHYPVEVQEVIDVTGAGDTVVAVTALGLSLNWDRDTLCRACNLAGGHVVGHFGATTISRGTLEGLMAP